MARSTRCLTAVESGDFPHIQLPLVAEFVPQLLETPFQQSRHGGVTAAEFFGDLGQRPAMKMPQHQRLALRIRQLGQSR